MKPTRPLPIARALLGAALLLAPATARTQQTGSNPVALPKPAGAIEGVPPGASVPAPIEPVQAPPAGAAPVAPAVPGSPAPLPPALREPPAPVKGGIVLNFQGAQLSEVLNYLSEMAGFVIIQEAQVSGTVNIVSRQPITASEAVDLLNAVLIEKGYVAIRNGRILKIVSRRYAERRDLPVQTGSDPERIPRNDAMVTQILPLRYGEAAKLMENLRPLLTDDAIITANESSNSILLTDTQNNINRIAQIIRAIDTSVASISTIHIYPLQYADAKSLATVVSQLFTSSSSGTSGVGGGRGGRGGFPGFPGFGGGGGQPSSGQSEAKQAASRIVAVADEQSNSLIVSAPEDLIPSISEVIEKLDTSIDAVTETRIFRLVHADSVELAAVINEVYGDNSSNQNNAASSQARGGRGGFGGFGGFGGAPGGSSPATGSSQLSGRALLQSKVVAVGDPRTNSLIVTASRESMTQVAETIGRLDSTDSKKQRVYVHSLEHADADTVANVLRGMLGDPGAVSSTQQAGASRLSDRSANGASMNTSDSSSNSGRAAGR